MTRRRPQTTRGRTFPPEILSDDEIRRLLAGCSSTAPTGIRNHALVAVMYRSGLRISEALDLRPKDIDHQNGALRVLHGKGDRARTVGLDPGAMSIVGRWLEIRANLGLNGSSPVFCTLAGPSGGGNRMTEAYVRVFLRRLARRAGIEKRVHPHGFRHTHAAELRSEGVDVGIISKQLGHRSIATTARYLDHIAPQDVIEAMSARAWTA